MLKWLKGLPDRIVSRLDLAVYIWTAVSVVSGYFTGHFAALNHWIASFGPIGYWTAGLLGVLFTAMLGLIFARIRLWWMTGAAIDKWKKEVTAVNPMDRQFTDMRIKIQDLAHPVTKAIARKVFTDCELMGPANLFFGENCNFQDMQFSVCDIIVAKPNTHILNCIGLQGVTMRGGSIWNATIYIPPQLIDTFKAMQAHIVTFEGNENNAPIVA